ncbi:MAG: ParB N-terminal domain-containing protein [Candidatus Peribacteraceae bacterium]|nr:ParB N-terminal domain-containing protein [Candidatus Peribacteraceae bacterium]
MPSRTHTIRDFITIFNGLTLPVGNLGVSRNQMPQIDTDKRENFIQYISNQGITIETDTVPVMNLSLTQAEINKLKIMKLMRSIRQKKIQTPVFISNDNYILDGSHRMVALLNINKRAKIPVIRIDMKMLDLLPLAKRFPGVRYRTYSGHKVE